MVSKSILRKLQYKRCGSLSLNGDILDLGGGRKSGYHELIQGEHTFTVANLNPDHGFDIKLDLEKPFPLKDGSTDHVLLMNVLEHVYDTINVITEAYRVMRPGGKIISCTPFMHHVHGSPDDYHRFTESAHRRMLEDAGFEVERIEVLGYGFFSLVYQSVGGVLPLLMQKIFIEVCVGVDKLLGRLFVKYRRLQKVIPLGYFVVAIKN